MQLRLLLEEPVRDTRAAGRAEPPARVLTAYVTARGWPLSHTPLPETRSDTHAPAGSPEPMNEIN